MLYLDKQFINNISSKFNGFKWKTRDVANCRCPLCGDSKKDKTKKRGYWFPRGDNYWYSCHNCGATHSLRNYLKQFEYPVYLEYNLESFKDKQGLVASKPKEPEISLSEVTQSAITPYAGAKRLLSLPEHHPAYQYLLDRKIPVERLSDLYYTPKFFKWASEWCEQFEKVNKDHPRLIIPFRNKAGVDIGFSARCFGPEQNKYIMIKFDNLSPDRLQYGLDKINYNDTIYCVEGPIDSMFVRNCVASCNAALHTVEFADILVYDNQPRNLEVVKMISKGIESDKAVVIWPEGFQYKDINEAVMRGEREIQNIIDDNVYYGLELKLKFSNWKKV